VSEQPEAELTAALEAVTASEVPPAPSSIDTEGDAFEALSLGVVRRQHAIAAMRRPDSIVAFEYQDLKLLIAARATKTDSGEFVLLAVGHDEPGRRVVTSAWRLYGSHDDVAALAADARGAFRAFLARYGLPYESHGRRVLFVPVHVTAATPQPDLVREFGLRIEPGHSWGFNGQARRNADGTWTMTWPFLVDQTLYQRDVGEHRR
jgi:hypothetical protein